MVERLHQRDKEKWKSICERLKMRETERDVQSRFDDIVSWIMVEQFVLYDGNEKKMKDFILQH